MNPEAYNQKVLATLEAIQKDVAEIKRTLPGASTANGAGSLGDVASDRDLDGDRGDPTIKYGLKEKYWIGRDYAGYRFSETEPEFLDAMAKYLDACAYMADKDPDEKKRGAARFKRLDAARARGWAARLRNGWKPPMRATGTDGGGAFDDPGPGSVSISDDDIPF